MSCSCTDCCRRREEAIPRHFQRLTDELIRFYRWFENPMMAGYADDVLFAQARVEGKPIAEALPLMAAMFFIVISGTVAGASSRSPSITWLCRTSACALGRDLDRLHLTLAKRLPS